jgi:hypothetical protein
MRGVIFRPVAGIVYATSCVYPIERLRLMPRKPIQSREFRLTIDAFTPTTIPMYRLAEYMADFAVLLGNEKSVHPGGLEKGSTILVARVEWEAEPKVRERLHTVRNRSGNDRVMEAAARLDDRLAQDNAKGMIASPAPSREFPSRSAARTIPSRSILRTARRSTSFMPSVVSPRRSPSISSPAWFAWRVLAVGPEPQAAPGR